MDSRAGMFHADALGASAAPSHAPVEPPASDKPTPGRRPSPFRALSPALQVIQRSFSVASPSPAPPASAAIGGAQVVDTPRVERTPCDRPSTGPRPPAPRPSSRPSSSAGLNSGFGASFSSPVVSAPGATPAGSGAESPRRQTEAAHGRPGSRRPSSASRALSARGEESNPVLSFSLGLSGDFSGGLDRSFQRRSLSARDRPARRARTVSFDLVGEGGTSPRPSLERISTPFVRSSHELGQLPSVAKPSANTSKASCSAPVDALDALVATQKKRLGEGFGAVPPAQCSSRQNWSGTGAAGSSAKQQAVPVGIGGAVRRTNFDIDCDDPLLGGMKGPLCQDFAESATAMTVYCPGSPSFISVCRPGSPEGKLVRTQEQIPGSPSVVFVDANAPKPRRPRQQSVRFECHRFPGEDENAPSKPVPRPATGGRPRRVAVGGA